MIRNLIIAASTIAGAGISLAIGLGAGAPALAQHGSNRGIEACPARLEAHNPSLTCGCSAEATESGAVWGSDVYTDDSAICRAARHAGVIGRSGGVVEVHEAPGQPAYRAQVRHGVEAGPWGSWTRSIAFHDRGDFAEARTERSGGDECPANAGSIDGGLSCSCSAEAANSTSAVWGSGPYTTDSNVCRAARHAGVIGARGGNLNVRIVRGQGGYYASARNGVSSFDWGNFGSSFIFDR